MHHIKDPLFQILFSQLQEARILLKADFPKLTIIQANQAWEVLVGDPTSYSGLPFIDTKSYLSIFPFDDHTLQLKITEAIAHKEGISLPAFIHKPLHAEPIWLELNITAIFNSSTVPEYLMLTLYDVTAKIQDQQALRLSQETEALLLSELQVVNEEISSANEELRATNEDLIKSQERLYQLNNQLEEKVRSRTKALVESEQKARFLISSAPVGIVVLTGKELFIESANQKMLAYFGKRSNVIGMPLHLALPEIQDQSFLGILDRIFDTGQAFYGNEIKADIATAEGQVKPAYFNFVYQPIKDPEGPTTSIMIVATEVTDQVIARKTIEQSAHQLNRIVSTTPIGLTILKGKDLIISIANDPILQIWGRSEKEIINKRLIDVFPELQQQSFPTLLSQVFETKKRVAMLGMPVDIRLPNGALKKAYVDFSYDPLFDIYGNVEAILASVNDVTELINNKKLLQDRQEELESLNEELAAANEELATTNEELFEAQTHISSVFEKLKENETRFRSLFEQSPVGMCFLKGEDLIIELVNDNMLQIWGRQREELIGRSHELARPELKGQPMNDWLREVYQTGIPKINNELKVRLYYKGGLREAYVHSLYHPLKDTKGKVTGILVILTDITPFVKARKQVEGAQARLNLAVQSAELGTWNIRLQDREFSPSTRLKAILGFLEDEEMSFDEAIAQIHDDYREHVKQAIENTIQHDEKFELEFPIVVRQDGTLRWIRATGRTYKTEADLEANFSGTVLDITSRKLEEIRKNDFIAIASHELKTPLTSLKGYLQIMETKIEKSINHDIFKPFVKKSLLQIDKMHSLIKGFLDVARLESGRLIIDPQKINLGKLIHEAIEEAELLSKNHIISIIDCEEVEVFADGDKIAQVLGNLLSNAIKYSPLGKNITINCKVDKDEAIVKVTDEGMGVKPHEVDRLFDRFYRVETKHTKAISGFGIGLYLCAEIIRLHHGRIWAESESGKGTSFYFSLPLA